MKKLNSISVLIGSYKILSTSTIQPNGNRKISFPANWHKHNGHAQVGRSRPPEFNLHGLLTERVKDDVSVPKGRIFRLFSE